MPANLRVWTPDLRVDDQRNSYQVSIQAKGSPVSGICMLKKSADGWRGTLINEMGVKAFDFMIAGSKCKLLNVIPVLDKWYIRKTLAADLYFLFEADNPSASFQPKTSRNEQNGTLCVDYKNKKSIARRPDGSVTMKNLTRHISYSLQKTRE